MFRMLADRLASRRIARHGASEAGFALLEVLVSFVILLIVVTAATFAVNAGISSASVTRNRVGAANVAQQALEQARALPRSNLTATPSATSTATLGSRTYTVVRSVGYSPSGTPCPTTIATDAPHEITVHVAVTPHGDSSRTVGMDTVIAC